MKTGVEPDPESTSDGPGTTDLDGDSFFQINTLSAGAHRVGPGPSRNRNSREGSCSSHRLSPRTPHAPLMKLSEAALKTR